MQFYRSNRGVSVPGTLLTHLAVSFSVLPQPNARNLTQRANRNCTVVMSSDPFTRGTGFIKPSFQARLEIRVSPESVEFTLICGGSALLGRILRLWSFFFFNCRLSDYLKCWYFINEPVSISGSWFFLACWSQDRIDNSELCLSGSTSTAVKTQSQLLTAWLVSVSVNQTLITDRLRVQIEWKAPTLSCRKWGPRHFCNN